MWQCVCALHFAFPLRNSFVWRKKNWFLRSAAKMGPLVSFLLRVYAQLKREKETCAKTIKNTLKIKHRRPNGSSLIFFFGATFCDVIRISFWIQLNWNANNIKYLVLLRRDFFIVNVLPVRIMFKLSPRKLNLSVDIDHSLLDCIWCVFQSNQFYGFSKNINPFYWLRRAGLIHIIE